MGAPIKKPRCANSTGWLGLLALPVAVIVFTPAEWPRWAFMWLLAAGLFAGFKWLTWWRRPRHPAPAWKHFGYLFGWIGLDAEAFLHGPLPVELRASWREWTTATMKTVLGAAILWLLVPQLATENELVRGWVGMTGLVLLLHFGALHLLSCLWRQAGLQAQPLMNNPLRATSLTDFWGNRWNTAFHHVAYQFLFRPLARRVGSSAAMLVGFLVSGLLHDLVISVPAGDGYGLPTLYFLSQAAGLSVERSALGRRLHLGKGPLGWLFTAVVVLGPAFLLFHPPFVRTVFVPFLDVLTGEVGLWGSTMREMLPTLILLAGIGQFSLLVVVSLLPSRLRWGDELRSLPRMHRQMHWVYAGYVVLAFVAFALISVSLPQQLASGNTLARSLCGYIAVFWGIRLGLQAIFDVKPYLTAWWMTLGYRTLTVLFAYLTGVYAIAALWP